MKIFKGIVKKISNQSTAIVEVERLVSHRIYKKVMKRSTKFKVDLSSSQVNVGDKVSIVETRPISKDKNFKIMTDKKEALKSPKAKE